MKNLKLLLFGFITGLTDAIPGVSGATVLLLFGIYDDTVEYASSLVYNQIPSVLKDVLKREFESLSENIKRGQVLFLVLLFIGISFGLVSSLLVAERLLNYIPSIVYGFFFGLISISAVIIWVRDIEPQSRSGYLLLTTGIFISVAVVFSSVVTGNSIPVLFVSGFIATFGMLLPGLSGSFLLLVIGKYSFLVQLVGNFARDPVQTLNQSGPSVITLGIGALLGVLFNLKIVSYFIDKNRQAVLVLILGLVIGGTIAPVREFTGQSQGSPILFVFGTIIAVATVGLFYLVGRRF